MYKNKYELAEILKPLIADIELYVNTNQNQDMVLFHINNVINMLKENNDDFCLKTFEDWLEQDICLFIEEVFHTGIYIVAYFYKMFGDEKIRNMTFGIAYDLWNYEEYDKIEIYAIKGIIACSVCGGRCNTINKKRVAYCSVNCMKK